MVKISSINMIPNDRLRLRDLNALKSGHDHCSRLSGRHLLDLIPADDLEHIWAAFGDADTKWVEVACRWLLRGLSRDNAVLKAKANRKASASAARSMYGRRRRNDPTPVAREKSLDYRHDQKQKLMVEAGDWDRLCDRVGAEAVCCDQADTELVEAVA